MIWAVGYELWAMGLDRAGGEPNFGIYSVWPLLPPPSSLLPRDEGGERG